MSKAKCTDCEYYYIQTSRHGKCVYKNIDVTIETDSCRYFKKTKFNILPLLNEIAGLLIAGNKSVVLLADGGPMFTLEDSLTINETEIILRTYCKPGVKYTVVPLEEHYGT